MKISVAWSKEPEGVNGVAVGRCPKGEDKEPRKQKNRAIKYQRWELYLVVYPDFKI
jgi:hypothetical protein